MAAGKLSQSELVGSLYSEHHGWLISWLRRKLGCPHSAADLAQDTFIRLMSSRPDDLRQPRAYLATVANSLVVDQWRRQALERAYSAELARLPEVLAPSPEEKLVLLEALARIDTLLDGLNPKARTAFLLSRLDGMSYPDIAQRLGVCLSSVEKYMAQALRHCHAARAAL